MKNNWYKDGLRFECTECGKCCSGAPGFVWIDEAEMIAMSEFLKIDLKDFKRLYVRRVGQRYSLVETKENFACVFLKNNKCQVYGSRPIQCRTFPWWPQNLRSERTWKETAAGCEGICDAAPIVPEETIEEQRLIQLTCHEKNC